MIEVEVRRVRGAELSTHCEKKGEQVVCADGESEVSPVSDVEPAHDPTRAVENWARVEMVEFEEEKEVRAVDFVFQIMSLVYFYLIFGMIFFRFCGNMSLLFAAILYYFFEV